jgi:PTS system fructose-specific IIA component/PTS system nitrogen regulatory IIA component
VIQATSKREVIEEMVGTLVSSDRLPAEHAEDIVDSIMKREDLGSTGIGRGVAVPHVKQAGVSEITGLVGQSKSGIDFHSLDGEPVYTIFLLISPPNRPGDHLRMLEAVSRLARNCDFPRL